MNTQLVHSTVAEATDATQTQSTGCCHSVKFSHRNGPAVPIWQNCDLLH